MLTMPGNGRAITATVYLMLLCCPTGGDSAACSQQTNKGREFVFGVQQGYQDAMNISVLVESLVIGAVQLISAALDGDIGVSIARGVNEIPLPYSIVSNGTGSTYNAIRLVADVDVTVVVQTSRNGGEETFLVYPVDVASTAYVIASYSPFQNIEAGFLITALYNDTDVFVRFPNSTSSSDFNISLSQYETYQYMDTVDLSGTLVDSDRPIGVVAGADLAQIPNGIPFGHRLTESIPPLDTLDTTYIIPPIAPVAGYVVKVLHGQNDAFIGVYNRSTRLNRTLGAMEHVEFTSGMEPLVIESDTPVLVAQYGINHYIGEPYIGDPFFTVIPGVSQYRDHYDFTVPDFHQKSYDPFFNYLAIAVVSSLEDGIVLDERVLKPTHRFSVPSPLDHYVVLVVNVSMGWHTIRHTTPDVTFGAFLYGFSNLKAYGNPVGMQLSKAGNCSGGVVPRKTSCFACDDMTSLLFCDQIQHCQDGEVCYVAMYKRSTGELRYRSGCKLKNDCPGLGTSGAGACTECCTGDFCNMKGCGNGVPDRPLRGPYCYDCGHLGDPTQCRDTALCTPEQTCGIEKYEWGGIAYLYSMSCQDKRQCGSTNRQLSTSRPICKSCCDQDLCNDECKTPVNPPIIG